MLLDLPPELLNAIFYSLDDTSQRNFVATCSSFRITWLVEAWRTLTLTGPNIRSQLRRLISWTDADSRTARSRTQSTQALFIRASLLGDDVPLELEGEYNTDILDEDIYPLVDWLSNSLKILLIDLPPMFDDQLFDTTLDSISSLSKLERLFLGRVKVNDGYHIRCAYSGLKEATMIWCHGIVEQCLLMNQPDLEHLDVHDSWDIGNLRFISYQWHNLKSFRFSAIDATYATAILENGRGAMTSLEDISLEVPMSESVFLSILPHLTDYPIRRFHLSLSAEGLGVFLFTPSGQNKVPYGFGPEWLRAIAQGLKNLEELVLDYRSGGNTFQLAWPGEQSTYASALSSARRLHTIAISIHAIPQTGRDSCKDIARQYMEHVPTLRAVHFPAMPLFPPYIVQSSSDSIQPIPETYTTGYSMIRISNDTFHSPPSDCYRPFWISHGLDVAIDRHRRGGGLRIVANEFDEMLPSIMSFDIDEPQFLEEPDQVTWLGGMDEVEFSLEGDLELGIDTPDEEMIPMPPAMSHLDLEQLDFSLLDEPGSDGDDMREYENSLLHIFEDLQL